MIPICSISTALATSRTLSDSHALHVYGYRTKMIVVDRKGGLMQAWAYRARHFHFTPQRWLQVNLPPNLKGCAAALGSTFPGAKIWVPCSHTSQRVKLVTAIGTSLYGASSNFRLHQDNVQYVASSPPHKCVSTSAIQQTQ